MRKFDLYSEIGRRVQALYAYITTHWILLVLALFTGSFTVHAADYYLHNPLYVVMTVVLTEVMCLVWINWLEGAIASGMDDNQLDAAETTQIVASVVGVVISVLAVIMTDIASARLLAVESGAFSDFGVIPVWAQGIVVNVVWVLAVSNFILVTVFTVSSPEAALLRSEIRSERGMRKTAIESKIEINKHARGTQRDLTRQHAPQIGRQQGEQAFREQNKQYASSVDMVRQDDNPNASPPTQSR